MLTLPSNIRWFLWLGLALAGLPAGHSQALVNINWGAGAQTFVDDSDVSTTGTLVQASDLGNFDGWGLM